MSAQDLATRMILGFLPFATIWESQESRMRRDSFVQERQIEFLRRFTDPPVL